MIAILLVLITSSALRLARKDATVIIHYHHLCKKEEYKTLALQHFTEAAEKLLPETPWTFTVVDFSKVKSYAPKLFHCCADIELKPL